MNPGLYLEFLVAQAKLDRREVLSLVGEDRRGGRHRVLRPARHPG